MKIGLAQIACAAGDINANIVRINNYCSEAAEKGCDVVVFPEMSDVGYTASAIIENAISWNGETFRRIREIALRNQIFLVCGISEKERNTIYNSIAIISPEGTLLDRYRKMHLLPLGPVEEAGFISPGSSLTWLTMGGMTWGFSICYDLRFPELYRLLTIKGTEVLVNCSAWPAIRSEAWYMLSKARAIENQAYFLGVNRVGTDGELTFCGRSCAIDPTGDVLATGSIDKEELLICDIEREKITSCRNSMPALENRRDDVYGNLGV